MSPQSFNIIGGAYQEASLPLNTQTLVNMYVVAGGPQGKKPVALYRSPGLTSWTTVGTGAIRGFGHLNDKLYAVEGGDFYEIDSNGVKTLIDSTTITTTSGRVSMADHLGLLLHIADGTKGYIFNGTTLAPITDANMPNATVVTFLGGRLVVDDPAYAGRFVASSTSPTVSSWVGASGLAWATAEQHADALVAPAAHGDSLYLIGEETTEVWRPSGAPIMPFSFVQATEVGCAAKWSVAHSASGLFWLAQSHIGGVHVVTNSGGGLHRISTEALDKTIAEYQSTASITDATGFCYEQDGHVFYQITFPSALEEGVAVGVTWVYDATIGQWHRRAAWDLVNGRYKRHTADVATYFAGKRLVGAHDSGAIYVLDTGAYSDNGAAIRWERKTPNIADTEGSRRLFFTKLTLDFEAGVGNASDTDPQVILDWSDDGGRTWSNSLQRPMGKIGEYKNRVVFSRLGSAWQRIFRIAGADKVKTVLIGATLDVEVGEA